MFDLRYHVASLAAVFLALVIGILVGVGISDPRLADATRLEIVENRADRLERERDEARARVREQDAAARFVLRSYEAVMDGRLAGKRIAVVSIGSLGSESDDAAAALADAGAEVIRVRALRAPLAVEEIEAALARRPSLTAYEGSGHLRDLGRDLGREFVRGGETPLWDALRDQLVEEQTGAVDESAEGVVVIRSAGPQGGDGARILGGFYEGLRGRNPVVGIEASSAEVSAVPVFRRAGFSTVDAIETRPGKVALAVVLGGGRRGQYGLKETAEDVVPPIEPVAPPPADE